MPYKILVTGYNLRELRAQEVAGVKYPAKQMFGVSGVKVEDGAVTSFRCWLPTLKTPEDTVRRYPLGSVQEYVWDSLNSQIVLSDPEDIHAASVARRIGVATLQEALEAQGVNVEQLRQLYTRPPSAEPEPNPEASKNEKKKKGRKAEPEGEPVQPQQ